MERDNTATETRIPLMPPQATLKAFTLHFFVALISLLVFGALAYLLCAWLKPVDFGVWQGKSWRGSLFSAGSSYTILKKLRTDFLPLSQSKAIASVSLLAVAAWIAWLRRRQASFQLKHLRLPGNIVLIGMLIVVMGTFVLMTTMGESTLGYAARSGFEKRVRFLLWLGADPNKPTAGSGYTPFYMAFFGDQDEIALLFLKHNPPTKQVAGFHLLWAAGLPPLRYTKEQRAGYANLTEPPLVPRTTELVENFWNAVLIQTTAFLAPGLIIRRFSARRSVATSK